MAKSREEKRKSFFKILFCLAALVFLISIGMLAQTELSKSRSREGYEALSKAAAGREGTEDRLNEDDFEIEEIHQTEPEEDQAVPEDEPEQEAFWYSEYAVEADREIDFDGLRSVNPDIYAWIEVPGTKIDYPVCHAAGKNDPVYIKKDIYLNDSPAGAVYTDGFNQIDFQDPNTLVYGHNMKDGTMFAGLHSFRDAGFFESHDQIKIYLPGGMLRYRIFAAYVTGDNHILAENDFLDQEVFERYLDGIFESRDMQANYRGLKLGPEDKIVTLCTCVSQENKRLFVQGALIREDAD